VTFCHTPCSALPAQSSVLSPSRFYTSLCRCLRCRQRGAGYWRCRLAVASPARRAATSALNKTSPAQWHRIATWNLMSRALVWCATRLPRQMRLSNQQMGCASTWGTRPTAPTTIQQSSGVRYRHALGVVQAVHPWQQLLARVSQ